MLHKTKHICFYHREMEMRIRKAFTLLEIVIIIVILGIMGIIVIPRINNAPNNEELVLMDFVRYYEEGEGRDGPEYTDLIVKQSPSHGPHIYTVRSKSNNLLWVVDDLTGQVDRADPDTGEIIEVSTGETLKPIGDIPTENPIKEPAIPGG